MPDAGVRVLPAISMLRDEEAARKEEDRMYPYTSQALANERVRDLHNDATRAQRARQVRLSRRARKAAFADIRVPDSYDDFLCQGLRGVGIHSVLLYAGRLFVPQH